MSVIEELNKRSGGVCELCGTAGSLEKYEVEPSKSLAYDSVLICETCLNQIKGDEDIDVNHWRLLNDSIWSEHDAVKVVSWRMLNKLRGEGWTSDLLDMMYMEDDVLEWAKASGDHEDESEKLIHKDSNGAVINAGDSVVLIKDLKVSGGGFTAKRGTAVRRVSLVHDNPEQIEGKVEGQQIVILTQYVKKI
ncbi:MAG: PhnA domain-containing protein [Putridiphycobacter sp.]